MYLVGDHGFEDAVMEARKPTGENIKLVHERSKVSSSIVAKYGDFVVSPIFSILWSDMFDVGVMQTHIQSASDGRPIKKCS